MTPPQCWCGNAITPRSKSTRSQRKSHDLRGSFFFQAEDGIRARNVTGVQTCALPVLPHMGWNTVTAPPGSALFAGIAPGTRFYFVHSYALRSPGAGQLAAAGALISWAELGEPFAAAAEQGMLAATQFHPEKSGDAGAALLANWLE